MTVSIQLGPIAAVTPGNDALPDSKGTGSGLPFGYTLVVYESPLVRVSC